MLETDLFILNFALTIMLILHQIEITMTNAFTKFPFFGVQLVMACLLIKCCEVLLTPYFVWLENQRRTKHGINIISRECSSPLEDYLRIHSTAIHDIHNSSVQLTVLVPAYNEEKRIRPMLKETLDSLNKHKVSYEIIVINDCSHDKTTQVVQEFFERGVDIKVVEYDKNRGKGGAIRLGGLLAKGRNILMADADAATRFDDYYTLQTTLNKMGDGLVIGTRHHLKPDQRSFLRDVLAKAYNFILTSICSMPFKDTQCGFKLFTKHTARRLFEVQHLERWAFDVELLMIAQQMNLPIAEEPVHWTEVDGSHLDIFEASFTMLRDFIMLRVLYLLHLWTLQDSFSLIR